MSNKWLEYLKTVTVISQCAETVETTLTENDIFKLSSEEKRELLAERLAKWEDNFSIAVQLYSPKASAGNISGYYHFRVETNSADEQTIEFYGSVDIDILQRDTFREFLADIEDILLKD